MMLLWLWRLIQMPDEPLIITEQFDEQGNKLFQTNRPVDANNPSDWKILKEAGLPVEVIEWTKKHLEWHEKMEREAAKRVRRERLVALIPLLLVPVFLGASIGFMHFGYSILADSMLLGWAGAEVVVSVLLRRGEK